MSGLSTAINSFGDQLRHWRKSQRLSQLDLALLANVSQRHLSFLESGRSAPTPEMILKLATVMELPLRTQNLLLSAAGFAPVHSETDLDAPEMTPIRQALDFMLAQQEPYPALVMDRHWNLLRANQAALKVLGQLVDLSALDPVLCPDGPINVMYLTLHPKGLMPYLENGRQVAAHLLQRLQREALIAGEASAAQRMYRTLLVHYPNLDTSGPDSHHGHAPFLSTIFVKDGMRLDVFSTITTLGTPGDITLQELRIESLFPADAVTEQVLKALAKAV
ncbi:MAG: XRE family transcriptional regulator [Candidatus Melainabacteria bacterium HGW-Melainabacteria-1]|nr:MAG: XRE family transcriptional regulator [Candidatus Melainabacteria bacterium HGW-Melainabacteria-1]